MGNRFLFYNSERQVHIFDIMSNNISTTKKGNLEWNFKTTHSKFDINFPPKTEARKKQWEKLKLEIDKQQLSFTKPAALFEKFI